MPSTTKTLTGPSKASKYPYRYQQDVKDRNDFRMKMKAELKAMARESFLEEMEKVKSVQMGGSRHNDALEAVHNSFTNNSSNNMSKFQRIVEDMKAHRQDANPTVSMLDWSTSASLKKPVSSVHSPNSYNQQQQHFGLLTARTDPGVTGPPSSIGDMSPPQTNKKKLFASTSKGATTSRNQQQEQNFPVNQMFVLSSAPIHSHEKLVHDQIHHGSTTLESSSLLEQANRYSELQSLFQPPAMSQDLLYDPENGLYASENTMNGEDDYAQQRRAQQTRQRLEQTIAQHKERLDRSRQEDRYYHSGLLAKSAQTAAVKPGNQRASSRHGFHNPGRRLVDTHSEHDNQQYSPPRSRSNSPQHQQHHSSHAYHHHHQPSDQQQHYVQDPNGRPMTSAQYHPNHSTHSLLSNDSFSASSMPGGMVHIVDPMAQTPMHGSLPAHAAYPASHTGTANNPQRRTQSSSSNMSVGSIAHMSGAPNTAGNYTPGASGTSGSMYAGQQQFAPNTPHPHQPYATISTAQRTPSPLQATTSGNSYSPLLLDESMQQNKGNPDNEPAIMSVEDFQQKTDRIDGDLRKVVRDAVHAEMLADGRAQHYTKRLMNKMVKEKEPLLVDRIEKAVGDKITSLQKELDALKAKKLRRFKRKGKRTASSGSGTSAACDNASIANGNDDDASYFGGYDIDDEELPSWLKHSGELLHVLERTQMNTGDPNDPHHIDVKTLNTEINRAIEITLRRLLAGEKPDYGMFRPVESVPMSVVNSEKILTSDSFGSKSTKSLKGQVANNSMMSKVHGRIETGKESSKAGDTFGDFDKIAPANAPLTSIYSDPLDDPVAALKAKKKSKAEKLLGISNDAGPGPGANTGNMPIDPSSASSRPGGSLFGQLGNLFSSKPTGPGMSASTASSRPSMMMSMVSTKDTSMHSPGPSSTYSPAPPTSGSNSIYAPPVRPGRAAMAPIIDEGDEEISSKKPVARPNSRGGSDAKTNAAHNKSTSSKGNSTSQKKKKQNNNHSLSHDDNDSHQPNRSDSMSSLHSTAKNGANDSVKGDDHEEPSEPVPPPVKRPPPLNPQLVAELNREETKYRELMQNLLTLADVKVSIKREIKDWERQFTMKTGREPSTADKATINDRYIAHKLATTQVQEAKDHIRACEDKLKEIRERAAAEQAAAIAAQGE